jgi:sirohydrochlorin cobaltochelatase
MPRDVVLLVGHGAPPRDLAPSQVARLKQLEGERRRRGTAMSDEERALDERMRQHPRTPENDPYFYGLARLGEALRPMLPGVELRLAFNEFCAPSLEQAVDHAVVDGAETIWVVSSMWTQGGVHAEEEIPETLEEARRRHPQLKIEYAWPFDAVEVAHFLAGHLHARGLPVRDTSST